MGLEFGLIGLKRLGALMHLIRRQSIAPGSSSTKDSILQK